MTSSGKKKRKVTKAQRKLRRGTQSATRADLQVLQGMLSAGQHQALQNAGNQLLEQSPEDGRIHHLLGMSFMQCSRWEEAAKSLGWAGSLLPEDAQILDHLAIVQSLSGRLSDARKNFRRCLKLDPDRVSALVNLALLELRYEEYEKAENLAQRALRLRPGFPAAQRALARALVGQSRSREAMEITSRLLRSVPKDFDVLVDAGRVYQVLGRYSESVDLLGRALQLRPSEHAVRSSYLFSLSNDDRCSRDHLAAEHRKFGEWVESNFRGGAVDWENNPDPERCLTVGLVSGDLRRHVVSYFLEPMLDELDPARVQVIAYSNYPGEDDVTARLRRLCSQWRDAWGQTDDDLARQIRADAVDILVDLSGHTTFNRLPVFARKPAPLQVSMLGYPNTTGMTAMDYRVVAYPAAPPGTLDDYFTEEILSVPASTAFRHPPDSPEVAPLPALARGFPTFGSFNRLEKVGERTLQLWAKVLEAVPDARLLVGHVEYDATQAAIERRLTELGVAPDRLIFRRKRPVREFLEMHAEVDVHLDSHPYSGGVTTQHALWMGVPVVSLAGTTLPSRVATTVLATAGLGDWVADTEAQYVALAAGAVADLSGLADLRQGLRGKILRSPLKHPANVARLFETALREIWKLHCEGGSKRRVDITPEMAGLDLPADLQQSCTLAASRGWGTSPSSDQDMGH